jgi:hypothetical protein
VSGQGGLVVAGGEGRAMLCVSLLICMSDMIFCGLEQVGWALLVQGARFLCSAIVRTRSVLARMGLRS